MIVKCAIAIAAYLASVFIFYFIANIVYALVNLNDNLLVLHSFVWPITIIFAVLIFVFCLVQTASDHVVDKIHSIMYERKRRRKEREDK